MFLYAIFELGLFVFKNLTIEDTSIQKLIFLIMLGQNLPTKGLWNAKHDFKVCVWLRKSMRGIQAENDMILRIVTNV